VTEIENEIELEINESLSSVCSLSGVEESEISIDAPLYFIK